MKTIQAKVNPRLLTKANRLFTGSLSGRIIEILQNARRASATRVEITNDGGLVTVRDNGNGISDFATLLDLGNSGWNEELESSEDPAGVGLFCLAPRTVCIRSAGQCAVIENDGWTGAPVPIVEEPASRSGTALTFSDEPWHKLTVEPHAVFTGMQVIVDNDSCEQARFVTDQAVHHPELGCRIEVRESHELDPWHHSSRRDRYSDNALVNFHGQVLSFRYDALNEHNLHFLVDLTSEPTGIRLMLPARTRLVENEGLCELQNALEREGYLHLQRRGRHRLSYKSFMRAKELEIELPEATPTFHVGLLQGDSPDPIEITMPNDFPLSKCYRMENCKDGDESNVHLLAALARFEQPFVPVEIPSKFDGYSWSNLPTIQKVELEFGDILEESYLWTGHVSCVESITLTAHCSDGKIFRSPVCMAVDPPAKADEWEDRVLVTREFRERLNASEIWYHLGGWCDDGDTYDTQLSDFEEQLHRFWLKLAGPDEGLRIEIFRVLDAVANWKQVLASTDGDVLIEFTDGTSRLLQPPKTIYKGGDQTCDVPPAKNESAAETNA